VSKFTERIRLVFDVDTVNSKKGFSQFGKDIREAEGLTGKMRAGVGSLSTTLKDNMGAAAIAGGAALVAFGVKAVGAFTDTAKAAIDMSKATGLSVEEASRLIAVGDDLGVSAEGLTAGLGKIAKTLDGTQWAKYGIATKDAGGNTRSTNDIFLDALETLGKISNETDRAAAGNELFGKGYANLAPIVGKTRAEMEDYLASVEDGQVITEKEAKQGEKMRLAMDHLSDALGEVTLATGKMVSEFAPVLDSMASGIEMTQEWAEKLHLLDYGMSGVKMWVNPIAGVTDAMDKAKGSAIEWSEYTGDELISTIDDLGVSTEDATELVTNWGKATGATEAELKAVYDALGLVVPKQEEAATATEELTDATKDQTDAWKKLDKALSDSSSFESVMLGLDDIKDELVRIDEEMADGSITWEEGGRKRTLALNDQKQAAHKLIEEVLKMPAEVATEIDVLIDQGKFDEAKAKLDSLKVVTSSVSAGVAAVGGAFGPGSGLGGAVGGAIVNNIYVNTMVADANVGRRIADALAAFYRGGGKRP